MFTRICNLLLDITFLNPLQSGFHPGDSTVNRLVHKINDAFERGKEVRMVYLDISKAFDRVWHKGLLFKLKLMGIKDPLLGWLLSYPSHRNQRVAINGQSANLSTVSAGPVYLKDQCLVHYYSSFVLTVTLLRIFNPIAFCMLLTPPFSIL